MREITKWVPEVRTAIKNQSLNVLRLDYAFEIGRLILNPCFALPSIVILFVVDT